MRTRLNVYQMAERFNVHPSTIARWRYERVVPEPVKLGGRRFWFLDEINEWEAAGFPRTELDKKDLV